MQYDFSVSAGGSQVIEVKGRFFKYKSGTGAIRVKATKGGFIDLLPGQGVWNVDFSQLVIQDRSGQANAGVMLAGEFDFHDDRIVGTVDVVDGGRSRTMAGMAFMSWNDINPSAGNISAHQIWNPVGSGKSVIIEQIQFSSLTAGFFGVGISDSALPVDAGYASCKKSGASKSLANKRMGNLPVMNSVASLFSCYVEAGKTMDRKFNEPVLLLPGYGLSIFTGSQNVELAASFEWFEETI